MPSDNAKKLMLARGPSDLGDDVRESLVLFPIMVRHLGSYRY